MIIILLTIIFAYLLGSISSAIVVSRLFKVTDPRKIGSGNPGTTNILRYAGKTAAALTLIGDITKGIIPIAIGMIPFVISPIKVKAAAVFPA